jgi:hypothetical protein
MMKQKRFAKSDIAGILLGMLVVAMVAMAMVILTSEIVKAEDQIEENLQPPNLSLSAQIYLNKAHYYASQAAYHLKWAKIEMRNSRSTRNHSFSEMYKMESLYHAQMANNYLLLFQMHTGSDDISVQILAEEMENSRAIK